MRCYFLHNEHIHGFEVIEAATDDEAILLAKMEFNIRQSLTEPWRYHGFELWDGARVVYQQKQREAAKDG